MSGLGRTVRHGVIQEWPVEAAWLGSDEVRRSGKVMIGEVSQGGSVWLVRTRVGLSATERNVRVGTGGSELMRRDRVGAGQLWAEVDCQIGSDRIVSLARQARDRVVRLARPDLLRLG